MSVAPCVTLAATVRLPVMLPSMRAIVAADPVPIVMTGVAEAVMANVAPEFTGTVRFVLLIVRVLAGIVILNGADEMAVGVPPKSIVMLVLPAVAVAVADIPAGRFENQPETSAFNNAVLTVSFASVWRSVE